MDRRRALGIGLVLVSACAFGSGALFAKPVYAVDVDWHVLSSWRFVIGALLSWAWLLVVPGGRAGLARLPRRAIAVSLGLGVIYTGNSGTYYAGLETVPASLAALIVYVYPALVAVLTLRFGRRLEGRRAWIALGLALVGVVLSVGGIPAGSAPPPLGLALIIASPVIYAFWIVLAAHLAGERRAEPDASEVATPPGSEAGANPGTEAGSEAGAAAAAATALMTTATAATWWVSALLVGREVLPDRIPVEAWPGLLGIGAVATFVAMQAFYAGARRIGAANAALVSTIEPIYTIVLAALLFGESLAPLQVVGGGLIIGGVLLAQTGPIARRRPRPAIRLADE